MGEKQEAHLADLPIHSSIAKGEALERERGGWRMVFEGLKIFNLFFLFLLHFPAGGGLRKVGAKSYSYYYSPIRAPGESCLMRDIVCAFYVKQMIIRLPNGAGWLRASGEPFLW